MKKLLWLVLGIILILVLFQTGLFSNENSVNSVDNTTNEEIEEQKEVTGPVKFYSGQLDDVTKSQEVRGINTKGESKGIAKSYFENNQYQLDVTFENLPDPQGTDFYEGWVVRKGISFSVKSTGKLIKEGEDYKNIFVSDEDLTDHSFYVLTLEPDDGDPAPADHILEGDMVLIEN